MKKFLILLIIAQIVSAKSFYISSKLFKPSFVCNKLIKQESFKKKLCSIKFFNKQYCYICKDKNADIFINYYNHNYMNFTNWIYK